MGNTNSIKEKLLFFNLIFYLKFILNTLKIIYLYYIFFYFGYIYDNIEYI